MPAPKASVPASSDAPMISVDAAPPAGPEDALGKGPKRGDYGDLMRLEAPHEAVPNPDYDPSKPGSPRSVLEPQAPRVAEVGVPESAV